MKKTKINKTVFLTGATGHMGWAGFQELYTYNFRGHRDDATIFSYLHIPNPSPLSDSCPQGRSEAFRAPCYSARSGRDQPY